MTNINMTKADLEAMTDQEFVKFIDKMKHHVGVLPGKGWGLQKNRQMFHGKYIHYPKNKNITLEWDYLFDQAFYYKRNIDNVECSIKVIETQDGFRCAYNVGGHYREASFATGCWNCDSDHWDDWFIKWL